MLKDNVESKVTPKYLALATGALMYPDQISRYNAHARICIHSALD